MQQHFALLFLLRCVRRFNASLISVKGAGERNMQPETSLIMGFYIGGNPGGAASILASRRQGKQKIVQVFDSRLHAGEEEEAK